MSQQSWSCKRMALVVSTLFLPASGFVVPQLGNVLASNCPLESYRCRPRWKVYVNPNDEQPDDTDTEGDNPSNEVLKNGATKPTPDSSRVSRSTRFIGNLVFDFWSDTITFLGVVFSLDIVLNLCGYGYRFSREEGIRIDTIENLRIERQFEQVSVEYGRDYLRGKNTPTQNSIDSNLK